MSGVEGPSVKGQSVTDQTKRPNFRDYPRTKNVGCDPDRIEKILLGTNKRLSLPRFASPKAAIRRLSVTARYGPQKRVCVAVIMDREKDLGREQTHAHAHVRMLGRFAKSVEDKNDSVSGKSTVRNIVTLVDYRLPQSDGVRMYVFCGMKVHVVTANTLRKKFQSKMVGAFRMP